MCGEGQPCRKGGADRPASNTNCKHARRGLRSTTLPALPAPPAVNRTPTQANQAQNNTRGVREEAQRGTWGPGKLCLSALFAKPRPPAVSLQTALFSQHCLMTHCHDSTLNGPAQKRSNYAYNLRSNYLQIRVQFASGTWLKQAT